MYFFTKKIILDIFLHGMIICSSSLNPVILEGIMCYLLNDDENTILHDVCKNPKYILVGLVTLSPFCTLQNEIQTSASHLGLKIYPRPFLQGALHLTQPRPRA